MDTVSLFSFLVATLVIVVTPGPSVALASSQAVRFGPRAAYLTVVGDALGSVVHILIAVTSIQTLIAMSDVVLPYLQIAGGMFIFYLAIQAFREAQRPKVEQSLPSANSATLAAGFFACVTNPKAIVFFAALFPGFISNEHNVLYQSLVYGLIFVSLDAAFILGYSLIAMYAFHRARPPRVNIETLSGLGLLGVGLAFIIKGYRALPSA